MEQSDQTDQPGAVDPTQPLPPNHPAINGMGNGNAMGMGQAPQDNVHGGGVGGGDEAAAVKWTAPKEWQSAPNPNQMRLATYKIKDDTELVVSRAGGDVQQNITRWAGQFDGSPTPKQTTKTVHGLKVTLVQIEGTFQGGMGPQTGSHSGWAMMSAIVETAGSGEHYFFKVVGPAATVKAAQKPFETMIDGLTSS